MNRNGYRIGIVGIVGLGLMGTAALSQEKGGDEGAPDAAAMAAWMKLVAPGEHHKSLQPMVGKWHHVSRYWMAPDTEPQVSEGNADKRMVLGGRFLEELYSSTAMGMPFEGVNMLGYDNMKHKFVSTWMDSMSTSIMLSIGTSDESGKIITLVGDYTDPFDGQKKTHRTITKIINNDKHVMEMFVTPPGGKEFKSLEIVYTRKS